MEIIVNGIKKNINPETTLLDILEELKVKDKTMAVAVNMEIVKEKEWSTHTLKENDKVELLHFVGGG